MRLDDFRIGVVPGDGVVARLGDALVVVPFDGPVDDAAVDRLLAECAKGDLAQRLGDVLEAAAGLDAFAVVAEADGGLAVHVVGDARAVVAGAPPVLHLSGRAPGWSNVFRQPFESLAVGQGIDGVGDMAARLDLRAGVVSGAGAVLVPATTTAAPVAAPRQHPAAASPVSTVMPEPGPTPAPGVMPEPGAMQAAEMPAAEMPAAEMPAAEMPEAQPAVAQPAMSPAQMTVAEPAAIPVANHVAAPAAVPAPTEAAAVALPQPSAAAPLQTAEVWGIRCKKGHFNDPEARYCAICGIHMVQDKAVRVKGPRPVLGYLVFDDGTTYKLDADYVIGRAPHAHDAVRSGQARPLVVGVGEDVINDVHARIILRDWDVLVSDCGSVYGTYVWAPGSSDWARLDGQEPVLLKADSRVMVAQRGFMFQPVNKR